MAERLAQAKAIGRDAALRARARADYCADNLSAESFRRNEGRDIGIRIVQAEAERLQASRLRNCSARRAPGRSS